MRRHEEEFEGAIWRDLNEFACVIEIDVFDPGAPGDAHHIVINR